MDKCALAIYMFIYIYVFGFEKCCIRSTIPTAYEYILRLLFYHIDNYFCRVCFQFSTMKSYKNVYSLTKNTTFEFFLNCIFSQTNGFLMLFASVFSIYSFQKHGFFFTVFQFIT